MVVVVLYAVLVPFPLAAEVVVDLDVLVTEALVLGFSTVTIIIKSWEKKSEMGMREEW